MISIPKNALFSKIYSEEYDECIISTVDIAQSDYIHIQTLIEYEYNEESVNIDYYKINNDCFFIEARKKDKVQKFCIYKNFDEYFYIQMVSCKQIFDEYYSRKEVRHIVADQIDGLILYLNLQFDNLFNNNNCRLIMPNWEKFKINSKSQYT